MAMRTSGWWLVAGGRWRPYPTTNHQPLTTVRAAGWTLLCALVLSATACDFFRRGRAPGGATTTRDPDEPREITNSRTLVRAMRARYGERWYSTRVLTQTNTRYAADGREHASRATEYASLPGRLRIEFHPLESRTGVLYERGRMHTFADGTRVSSRSQPHPVLLLTADVYAQPVDSTLSAMQRAGIVIRRFHENRWRGRNVFVTGAAEGDTTSTQAWIDAETLTLVRLIEREPVRGRAVISDTHVGNWRGVSGYPIPHEVVVHRGGRTFWRQEMRDVRVNAPLSASLFEPARWRTAQRP